MKMWGRCYFNCRLFGQDLHSAVQWTNGSQQVGVWGAGEKGQTRVKPKWTETPQRSRCCDIPSPVMAVAWCLGATEPVRTEDSLCGAEPCAPRRHRFPREAGKEQVVSGVPQPEGRGLRGRETT